MEIIVTPSTCEVKALFRHWPPSYNYAAWILIKLCCDEEWNSLHILGFGEQRGNTIALYILLTVTHLTALTLTAIFHNQSTSYVIYLLQAGSEAGGLPEDLRELEHCNESSLVSALAARFQAGRHQTWLGDHCTVTINPMRQVSGHMLCVFLFLRMSRIVS